MQLTADLSQLHPEVRRGIIQNLQHEDAAQYALGAIEQAKLKKFYDAVAMPGFSKKDVGPLHFIISPDQAARCRAIYGDLCFMDPDFVKWLKKGNEDMRVREVGTKIQSGWTPGMKVRGQRRNAVQTHG